MATQYKDILDHFRKRKITAPPAAKAGKVRFQLCFDDIGGYLNIVDEKGCEVAPDPAGTTGIDRMLIEQAEAVSVANSFRVDWNAPDDRMYITDAPFLFQLLREHDRLVDEKNRPIHVADGRFRLGLTVRPEKDGLKTQLAVMYPEKTEGPVRPVAEDWVVAGRRLISVEHMGPGYAALPMFETRVLSGDLEKFLSLLFSNADHIDLLYEDYTVVQGPDVSLRPAIVFERVDSDQTLHLRVTETLPEWDPDFFENFRIQKIAVLDEENRHIRVSEIASESRTGQVEISRLLKKRRKSLKNAVGFHQEDNYFIIPQDLAEVFLQSDLPRLVARFDLLGAETLKAYRIKPVSPKLNLRLSHGIDFLAGNANLSVEDQELDLFDVIAQYKKNRYIRLTDGTMALVNPDYMEKLSRIFRKEKEGVSVSFFDLPLVEELIEERIAEELFPAAREVFWGFNDLNSRRISIPNVDADLRPYQKQGYKWLHYLYDHHLGGCLADEMGLGKTLQIITLLAGVYPEEKQPSLIVMPKSLLFNWENEIRKFCPRLTYAVYHGPGRKLDPCLDRQLILTTYATLRNDIDLLRKIHFHLVALDESQYIKNAESQTSQAAALVDCDHRLALSGTPIENHPGELYALFRFLNPAMFGSAGRFNRDYMVPIQKENDRGVRKELRKKIYPFILRRLKKDVIKDLPDKIEQTLYVEMSEAQASFYEARRRFFQESIRSRIAEDGMGKSRFLLLQAMGELRQIATVPEARTDEGIRSPKRQILLEHAGEVLESGHKILVFSNYLHALDSVSQDFTENGIEHLVMTGATKDRKNLVERFQTDQRVRAFLMTLKTGGLGLNLTAADYIYILDPWYNFAAENQAIDRTHRIGQKNTVFAYRLITRGSIEEKILELQAMKKELFNDLITADGAAMKFIDETDIEFILGA